MSLMQSLLLFDLHLVLGLASDSHDLPTVMQYAVQFAIYGRTVLIASPICMNRSLVHWCTATSVLPQNSIFRLFFFFTVLVYLHFVLLLQLLEIH